MESKSIIVGVLTTCLAGCGLFGKAKTSSDLERELDRNFYTGSFQPVQPFTFEEKYYSTDINDDCFDSDLKKRKLCWLDNLPNSEDYVSIADSKYRASLVYGNSGVSAEGGKYEIVSQWVRFFNAKPLDAEGGAIEGEDHKVGVGARIVAQISTKKAGINLSDLFAVAAAAEREDVQGSLLFTIQGVHGKGVDTYTPKLSKLDTENLQRALEAVQNIKTLLHNDDTIQLTAQVVAIRKIEQENSEVHVVSDEQKKVAQSAGVKSQGWIYVGYFDDKGMPNGTTYLQVSKVSDIKVGRKLLARGNLNVRAGYPKFPTYNLYEMVDTVDAGVTVTVNKIIKTGINKYWALIEY